MSDLLTALALALAIEGMVYALFPEAMQRQMARLQTMDPAVLRTIGIAAAGLGVGLAWLFRRVL